MKIRENIKQAMWLILSILIGCGSSDETQRKIVEENNIFDSPYNQDIVLERNNPNSLDLTKNQLFIDTTREALIYKFRERKIEKNKDLAAKPYFDTLRSFSKPKIVDFRNFPRFFIRINKLEGNFFLYDRCDGGDPRYELRDSAVVFSGPLETYAETINEVIQNNDKRIHLKLNTIEQISSSRISSLEIYESEFSGIYILKRKVLNREREEFIIPRNEVIKYDLIVNHCPEGKVFEYKQINHSFF